MGRPSIRLGLVDRLERLVDQIGQLIAQRLSKPQVHPQTSAYVGLGPIVSVNNRLGEGQVNHSAELAAFNKKAGNGGWNTTVNNRPLIIANAKCLAGANHDFIAHQKSPIGKVLDLSSVNAKLAGVQR